MKIVVGLGNPGTKYRANRHNVGYLILAEFAQKYATGRAKSKFHADVMEVQVNGEQVLLVCPTTYMNNSGLSVSEATRFYKVTPENILVVCDDMNIPFARLRLRAEGSYGGQKGLQDIIRVLGTDKFPRLRFGIGRPPEYIDPADYVLSNFNAEEQKTLPGSLRLAAEAVELFIKSGISEAMNKFNA
ncbi:MAG: aminoacyl-tRNA hydrolase [Thermoguttaceae bacterium]